MKLNHLSSALKRREVVRRFAGKGVMLGLALTSVLMGGVGIGSEAVAGAEWSAATRQTAQGARNRPAKLPRAVLQNVLQDAMRRSGAALGDMRIMAVDAKTFSNNCVFNFGDVCTYEYTPIAGWEIVVNAKGQSFTYHVNQSGSQIAINPKLTEKPVSTMPGAYIDAVIMDAARRASVAPATVKILQSKPTTFGNLCAFNFGEICTKDYNPIAGYAVTAQVKGQSWNYHVSQNGAQVVLDPKAIATTLTLPGALQTRILNDAATRSGLPVSSLQITQATEQNFGNACVFNFGEMCPQVYQPIAGWQAVVKVRDQAWTYRIDRTGSQLALDPRLSPVGSPVGFLPAAVQTAVLQNARTWTNTPTVRIVSAKAQTWGNDCGFNFGKLCPANFQPIEGWEVQVSAGQLEWNYRTNKDGSRMVMDRRVALPSKVAEAIVRDIAKRSGPTVAENSLRFLEVKEQSNRVCFLFKCQTEPGYLTVVSNGRQQWGYRSDDQGRKVLPVSVAQVRQAVDQTVSQR